ncbi:MAG: peptidylprolyl isomerase [Verrucomicrobiota bacterium]
MAFFLSRRIAGLTRPGRALAAVILAAALLTACHPAAVVVTDPNDPKFVVAERTGPGGWTITRAQLNTEVDAILRQNQATREQVGPAKMPQIETRVLQRMVLKKLILDKAASMALQDVDKEAATQLDQVKGPATEQELTTELQKAGMTLEDLKMRIRDSVIIRKVLEAEAFKSVDPTEQEIDAIYLAHKDSFTIPATVRVSRILIHLDDTTTAAQKAAKKKVIDKAHERVTKGKEDFSKVAAEVSEDRSSAPKGGDLGRIRRGESEPGFDEVAFNTKVNAVSPVFSTSLGWQFIKVTDSQPAGIVPVAEARGIIGEKLRELKKQQASEDYAQKLLASSGVAYHIQMADLTPPNGGPGAAPGSVPPPAGGDTNAPAAAPVPASGDTNAPAAALCPRVRRYQCARRSGAGAGRCQRDQRAGEVGRTGPIGRMGLRHSSLGSHPSYPSPSQRRSQTAATVADTGRALNPRGLHEGRLAVCGSRRAPRDGPLAAATAQRAGAGV